MGKRFFLFCFVLFCFAKKQSGQNLVPNPSFETQNDCNSSIIDDAFPWHSVCYGGHCSSLSPCKTNSYTSAPYQYADSCFQSYQLPRTGNLYAEFGTYIQSLLPQSVIPCVKLNDTLKFGKIYCVTYYVSMWNNARYSIDKLGALLTATPLPIRDLSCNTTGTLNIIPSIYIPQILSPAGVVFEDTLNWMEVSGTYTAIGNEAHLAIGDLLFNSSHFIKNSYPSNCNTLSEYYVDDVSVEEVKIAQCKNDTTLCQGDSLVIGNNFSEATLYNWQPNIGLNCTTCANPKASPLSTTTYTCYKTQCKIITQAVITLSVNTNCNPTLVAEALEIPNVFTPNGDGVNDTFTFTIKGIDNLQFSVYNRWGNLVHQITDNKTQTTVLWNGTTTLGIQCNAGVYFYVLEYTDTNDELKKKNGYITLIN